MMSCDIEVDSGPESEYNFEDMDKDEKPARQQTSSAARVSIGAIQVGKPPMKVASCKPIYHQGFDPDAIIKGAPKEEEQKLPDINKPKVLKIG